MSYYKCPHCGEELSIFGKSKLEEVAKKHGIEKIFRLPIDPAIATACDEGSVEKVESKEMDDAFDYIMKRCATITVPQPSRDSCDGNCESCESNGSCDRCGGSCSGACESCESKGSCDGNCENCGN